MGNYLNRPAKFTIMLGVDFLLSLVHTYGYLAVFVSGFFSTFSLFIPSPTFIVVFLLGSTLNPLLLGIIGGLGAAVGEMIGYAVGYAAGYEASRLRKGFEKKRKWVEKMFEKYKPPVVIFLFSAMPLLPFDLVGIFCGLVNYDKKKFFIITSIGKIIKYTILAYAGFYGMTWVLDYFNISL